MAAKPVAFHKLALADYEEAFEWYFSRSEIAAERFAEEMDRAISEISFGPKRWAAGPNSTRRFPLRSFPFAVVYRDHLSGIQVIAVAHAKRRPGYWINRLR
jgi:plasmid stabilization system protein ParE